MTRQPTPTALFYLNLLGVASVVSGCGEGLLRLQLAQLPGDTPYNDVVMLDALVTSGDTILLELSTPFESAGFDLGTVSRRRAMAIEVTGRDDRGFSLARGAAAFQTRGRGEDCCLILCFCSLAFSQSSACECGSNGCTDACRPQ